MDPLGYTRRRLEAWRGRRAAAGRLDRRLSWARGLTFAATCVVAWPALVTASMAAWWVLPPLGVFLTLLPLHEQVLRRRERARRAVAFHEEIEARLEERWAGRGRSGVAHRPDEHAYADDLDLFGAGSLFERLCSARTVTGEATLARWLLTPACLGEVRRRQEAVAELRDGVELREDVALLGAEVGEGLDPDRLVAWGMERAPLRLSLKRWIAAGTATLFVGGLVALASGAGPWPALLSGALAAAVARVLSRDGRGAAAVGRASRELQLLGGLLERLEQEGFAAERLTALQSTVLLQDEPPSRAIARLVRLVDLLDARRNQLFLPVALALCWGTQLSLAIEAWRARHGPRIAGWLRAVGELEALLSLAAYSWERPEDPFPEIFEGRAAFAAQELAHPLLPEAGCVRNDVRLGAERQLLLVSGSNMSGKSTLLRAVGVNAVLALAGAPVRAASLQLSPLAVGASIRIVDSLQHGTSRFYAEIQRLAGLMAIAEAAEPPLLFLLDEMLSGTNSHDRRIGAEAVVVALVERGAIGLVTTHDLALARIVEALGKRAANVHFEDRLEDGRVLFDYRMRDGVVQRSNALELMRTLGLPV